MLQPKSLLLIGCGLFLIGFFQQLCLSQAQKDKPIMVHFLFSFGSLGSERGQFKEPQALSIDLEGNIYVADTGNNRLQKFDARGNFIKEVGGFGWEKEQFHRPLDVCARSALDVFVADYHNQRIERYDRNLNYISSLYSDEALPEKLQFGRPCGLGFSGHRELFIVDDENHRILKISSFGVPETSFGDFDWGQGKLDQPVQVEISQEDKIFVSDEAGKRIVVFDYFGNYLTEIGTGLLSQPKGLFWDESGRLLVADAGHHQVIIFDGQGSLIGSFASGQKTLLNLQNPVDVVARKNWVYVLDSRSSSVKVFELTTVP
ncbi:MAG: NHL repeat-containing protein [candidate division KSB1 bacterium]|nr:NHL repeat-containing protein [candidate division KSB1 bacterium]